MSSTQQPNKNMRMEENREIYFILTCRLNFNMALESRVSSFQCWKCLKNSKVLKANVEFYKSKSRFILKKQELLKYRDDWHEMLVNVAPPFLMDFEWTFQSKKH
jgi:hypothetical protein